jgi:hypothetical protein
MDESNRHWSEDRYWTDALDRYAQRVAQGESRIVLDLAAIAAAAFNVDGPAYKLMGTCLPPTSEQRQWRRGSQGVGEPV